MPRVPAHVLALPQSALGEGEANRPRNGVSRLGIVFSALARLAGVDAPSAEWQRLRRETFDNSIGELVLIEREASVTIRRSPREGEDVERLVELHTTQLTNTSPPQ